MTAVLEPRRNADGVPVMVDGRPNPTGTGRYCLPPPGTCYCGGCPHHTPALRPNYRAAIEALHGREYRDKERKRNRG